MSETISISTDPSPAPAAAASSVVMNQDLKAADQALAAELDAMLDGEFETIDAVLHGSQSTTKPGTSIAADSKPNTDAAARIAESSASSVTPAQPAEVAGGPQSAPVAIAAVIAATSTSTNDAQMTSAGAASVTPVSPPQTAAGKPLSPPAVPAESTRDFRRPGVGVADDASTATSRSRFHSLRQPVVNVLMLINFPLRLIPNGLKPAVDWMALSLLVWVPIVWVLVFVIGTGNRSAHAGSADTAEQSLHGESTNNAKTSHETGGHESSGGGHEAKKSTAASGHDSGHSSAKSKEKGKSPPSKAAGNKLPKEKSASSKSKSKSAESGAHH